MALERHENFPERIPVLDDSSSATTSSSCSKKNPLSTPRPMKSTKELESNDFTLLQSPSYESPLKSTKAPERDDFSLLQSPSYESPAAFENFDFETPLRWYKRVWSFILCIAGIFDILAYMEPSLRSSYDAKCASTSDLDGSMAELLFDLEDSYEASVPWYCSTWITFMDRLHDYNVVIAFAFSLLWFKHSQSKAREEYYYKSTVQEDRLRVLPARKRKKKRKMKKFNARNIYYRRILSRTLLLPVGFYVILYHLIRGLFNGQWLYRELLIAPANETAFLTVQDPSGYVTIEISKANAKMSTIFAILTYVKHRFLLATALARTEFLKNAMPRLRRKLVGNLVRNPRNFIRQLKVVLRYVRWTKYIIPLVIKLNKLRGNTVATLRKRRQYSIAKKKRSQRLNESALFKKKSQAMKEENAAILIQRAWRSRQNYLYQRVCIHFVKDKQLSAAMKIQLAFRRMALNARIKASRKRRELFHLEQLKRKNSERLNDEERRRLYELQDEFLAEAKETINKRLLIRPNTKLSVLWNSIFIFCVLVEISNNALKPWLKLPKAKRADDQEYKSMRLFLSESLIPTPVAETPRCKNIFKKQSPFQRLFYRRHHVEQPTRQEVVNAFIDEIINPDYDLEGFNNYTNHTTKSDVPWRCSEPISTWRDGFRDIVALTLCPNPVTEWPACNEKEKSLIGKIVSPFVKKRTVAVPWYCTKPYSVVHNWYRLTWNFIIDQILEIISVICFFDVFVKFFTGEIDPVTGELRPKPFLRRWIFPGLLLQLLVNPAIGSFSAFFFRITDAIMEIGPVRVLRWCIAVVVPIVYALRNIFINALQEAESDKQLAKYRMLLWEYSY